MPQCQIQSTNTITNLQFQKIEVKIYQKKYFFIIISPKKHYFSSYKNILKPEILMKFIKSSKKVQKSYQKD